MATALIFEPLLPLWALVALAGLAVLLVAFALWRRAPGWWLRGLAFAALLLALAGPSLREELRDPLPDVAFLVIDASESQGIEDRAEVTARTAEEIEAALRTLAAGRPGVAPLETRTVRVARAPGTAEDGGTRLLTALGDAAAEVASDRIAGAILVTDGQVHDAEALAAFPGPVHVLLTGRADEWDRRLRVETAPAFGIVGEEVTIRLAVEALGQAQPGAPGTAELLVSTDGGIPRRLSVPLGRASEVRVPVTHGGPNVIEIVTPPLPGELTDRNNRALLTLNGVRDRLRVLLVSGEPHPGERTWRNLLKADPSVDLVHFTILRPPEKQDGVPVFELSLIAFPTRELFMEKIDEFDLIIFDRYNRRGILPRTHLANVVRYVREGGAVLVASGAAYAGPESLHRSPLRDVLPAEPSGQVLAEPFLPAVTTLGRRHPVTEDLDGAGDPGDPAAPPTWGRWFRLVDLAAGRGDIVMAGPAERPLLVLDRQDEGRVAMLASDHIWLWSRGFEGGGPQAELLRRLAHWLMKEPELEEEAMTARVTGDRVEVTRRSLRDDGGSLRVVSPSGVEQRIDLTELRPGRRVASFTAGEQGLWRLSDERIGIVVAVGPPAPKEFENPVSSAALLGPLVEATRGGVLRLAEAGTPEIRRVRADRRAAGRGWIGLALREAHAVRDIRLTPLAPGWIMVLLASGLLLAAWRVEGR